MKIFLIALLAFVAATAGVWAAEEETGHMAGRAAKAPGHPGYAQVSDDDLIGAAAAAVARDHRI